MFVGHMPGWKGFLDRQAPVSVELVGKLSAKRHQRLRAAIADQRFVEDAMQPFPLPSVFEVFGVERTRRSAKTMLREQKLLWSAPRGP